jgi:hypothetical protein
MPNPNSDIDDALAQLEEAKTRACPATSTEMGSLMKCILPYGHTELHSDGCVGWFEPFRELDADTHAEYLKWKERRRKK